jgi:hypothetical protein
MKIINILVLLCTLILMSSFVSASSQSFGTVSVSAVPPTAITNGNETNSSTYDFGTRWTHSLVSLTVTDSSTQPNASILGGCNESLTLWYGLSGADNSISITGDNTGSGTTTDLSSITSNVRYVKLQSKFSYYGNVSNCTTSATLSYQNGLEEISGGIPSMGTNVGGFLSNLAPGVGAFIIIMAILGGIGALIYGIVDVVKKKMSR